MNASPQPYPKLFQRGRIGQVPLRNRVIMGVFPTYYAQESQVTDRLLDFYRARAKGGAAMIVVEGPSFDFPHDFRGGARLRLDDDAFLPGLRRLAQTIHAQGAKAFLHLFYPPRIGSGQARVSLVDQGTADQLRRLPGRFGQAASMARGLGFDGVEVQAGWGELLSRLLSPAFNRRTDDYGGPLANRARLLLEVVAAIRDSAGPSFPIQVKLGVKEYVPGGFDLEEGQAVAIMLEQAGVASILVSAGTGDPNRRWAMPTQAVPPAPTVPLAAEIKRVVGIPVVTTGKIKGPDMAEGILEEGQADFIALTRPLITDPQWCRKARTGKALDIRGCIYCLQECAGFNVPAGCTVNPSVGREGAIRIRPARKGKKVVVVGGGPAGIQAAVTASERGHSVHLYEQTQRLGGPFAYPNVAEYKGDVAELARYLEQRVRQQGIQVSLGVKATASRVLAEKPDVVVIATGSKGFIPPYPGAEGKNVLEAGSLWTGENHCSGRRVAVIGAGTTAFETGDWLADHGAEVTVLTRRAEFLRDLAFYPKFELTGRLEAKGVKILNKVQVVSIEPDRLTYQDEEGKEHVLAVDNVVMAAGVRPEANLAQELEGKVKELYLAGDCQQPGLGGPAIRSGLAVGMRI